MATHSSVLAWRIPRTGEHGGLPSLGSHRVEHDWSDLAAAAESQSQRRICKTKAEGRQREIKRDLKMLLLWRWRGPQGKEEGTEPSQHLDFRTSDLLNCEIIHCVVERHEVCGHLYSSSRKPNQGGTGEMGWGTHSKRWSHLLSEDIPLACQQTIPFP